MQQKERIKKKWKRTGNYTTKIQNGGLSPLLKKLCKLQNKNGLEVAVKTSSLYHLKQKVAKK